MKTRKIILGTLRIMGVIGFTFTALGGYSQTLAPQKLVNGGVNARPVTGASKFGSAVAISGDWMVVGSPGYDYRDTGRVFSENCGGVTVYRYNGSTWNYYQRLEPNVGNADSLRAGDEFGYSVDIDGDYIAIGARYYDHRINTYKWPIVYAEAGAAYVFARTGNNWNFQAKLIGAGTRGLQPADCFGSTVRISGNTIAVGVPRHSFDSTNAGCVARSGAVFVYTRSNTTWSFQQKLFASGVNARNAEDNLGTSLSISGNYIVAGAPEHEYDVAGGNKLEAAGAAFVFLRSGSTWNLQQKLVGTGTNGRKELDYFGQTVAISNNYLVVGAPYQDYDATGANYLKDAGTAYVFALSGSAWTFQKRLTAAGTIGRTYSDFFSFSMNMNQNFLVIGNPWHSIRAGAVAIISAGSWLYLQTITVTGNNNGLRFDQFGCSVGISSGGSGGTKLAVGAFGQGYNATGGSYAAYSGAVYTYKATATTFGKNDLATGTEVSEKPESSIGSDGKTAFIRLTADEGITHSYRLFDMQGRVVGTGSVTFNGNEGRVDLNELPAGVYVLDIPSAGVRAKVYRNE